MSGKAERRQHFHRWWRKNNKARRSHDWLAFHARRVAYGYHMMPGVFDRVKHITKRYHNSEYKRLGERDAWTLWKLIHPLHTERVERLLLTTEHLIQAKAELESAKKTIKSTIPDKKTFTVERKVRRVIASPTQ